MLATHAWGPEFDPHHSHKKPVWCYILEFQQRAGRHVKIPPRDPVLKTKIDDSREVIASADPCLPCVHMPTLYSHPLYRCERRKAGQCWSRIKAWQKRGHVVGSKAIKKRQKPRSVRGVPRRKREVNSIQSKVECWERVWKKHPILPKSVLAFNSSMYLWILWENWVFMVTYTCYASNLEAEAGR